MFSNKKTPEVLRAEADHIESLAHAKQEASKKEPKIYTVSHMIMAGIMMMFFVGVGLGVYVTVYREVNVNITLDYIMQLARFVSLGYFVKAFGENIAKIVLSNIFGGKLPDTKSKGGSGSG